MVTISVALFLLCLIAVLLGVSLTGWQFVCCVWVNGGACAMVTFTRWCLCVCVCVCVCARVVCNGHFCVCFVCAVCNGNLCCVCIFVFVICMFVFACGMSVVRMMFVFVFVCW